MSLTIADQYYLKALDEYPYDLEFALENINYALSYEREHSGANCMMGLVYMEQFQQYDIAEDYFVESMANDPLNLKTCHAYIKLLIETSQCDKAFKLIAYAQKLKGADKATFLQYTATIYERKKNLLLAKAKLNEALHYAYTSEQMETLEGEIKRLEKKADCIKKINYKLV